MCSINDSLDLDISNIDIESRVESQEKRKEARMTQALNNLLIQLQKIIITSNLYLHITYHVWNCTVFIFSQSHYLKKLAELFPYLCIWYFLHTMLDSKICDVQLLQCFTKLNSRRRLAPFGTLNCWFISGWNVRVSQ